MNQRRFLILSLVMILVLATLSAFVFLVVLLLNRSAGNTDQELLDRIPFSLPLSSDRSRTIQVAMPSGIPQPTPSSPPTPTSQISPSSTNLALQFSYTTQPEFSITLDQIFQTTDPTNLNFFKPQTVSQPHTIVELLDSEQQVILTERFVVTTSFNLESQSGQQTVQQDTGSLRLIVSALGLPVANTLRLRTPQGDILAEQNFNFSELDTSDLLTIQAPNSLAQSLIPIAHAAPSGTFPVAVLAFGQVGNIEDFVQRVRGVISSVEPYAELSSFIPIINTRLAATGCRSLSALGTVFTVCENTDEIIRLAQSRVPDARAVIVVSASPCNCGVVTNQGEKPSNVVTLGMGSDARTIAHELGHIIGGMSDEYFYDDNISGNSSAPNCFSTELDCRQSIEGAECSLGCSSAGVTSYRPATQLMYRYNASLPVEYGPWEACLVELALLSVLDSEAALALECNPNRNEDPSATDNNQFFGGGPGS